MAKTTLPADPALAHKVLDAQSAAKAQRTELGLMGILGDIKHKPANVAFIVILLAFGLILAMLFIPVDGAIDKADVIAWAGTLVTGALGFVFGRASTDRSR